MKGYQQAAFCTCAKKIYKLILKAVPIPYGSMRIHIILPPFLIIIEILTEHFVNDGNGNFKSRQIIEKVKWRGNIES